MLSAVLFCSPLEVQVTSGLGMFPGEFGQHIDESGAWPWTPVLDSLIILYPWPCFGVGMQWGSMAVIHPQSEPIEGIIRYQSLYMEVPLNLSKVSFLLHTGVGFQDPGMLLSVYGSGFWNAGVSASIPWKNEFSFIIRSDYRSSFFKSLVIDREYDDWDSDDTLQTLSIGFGLRYGYRSKNNNKE